MQSQESLGVREGGRRFEDAILLALNVEEEAISQKLQVDSRRWETQKHGFCF